MTKKIERRRRAFSHWRKNLGCDKMALCQRLTRAEINNRENVLDVLNNSDMVKLVREVVSPYQDEGYKFAYDYTYMVVQGKKVGNTFTYSDAMGCLLIQCEYLFRELLSLYGGHFFIEYPLIPQSKIVPKYQN